MKWIEPALLAIAGSVALVPAVARSAPRVALLGEGERVRDDVALEGAKPVELDALRGETVAFQIAVADDDAPIEGVTIENVRIITAGARRRRVPLDVPERPARYPEVTMFGLLPAFGLYVRHARDVTLRNVPLSVEQPDIRPALVADDVTGLHVMGLDGWLADGDAPAVWLNNVRGGIVETSSAT